jgi:hypothetical protein
MAQSAKSLALHSFIVFNLLSSYVSNIAFAQSEQKEPFKLGVEQKYQMENPGYADYPSYPAPQMVGQPMRPNAAPIAPKQNLRANINQNVAPPPVMRPQTPTKAVLPVNFLGVWQVIGQRQKVEAIPEFQAGANQAFAPNTSNTWQIEGNPNNGYSIVSDTGVRTQLTVDKVQGNTAWIRYQHQIGNTMAQEAIVMMLGGGGAQFSGLERISIVKPNEGKVRAKVTYQLMGQRRR